MLGKLVYGMLSAQESNHHASEVVRLSAHARLNDASGESNQELMNRPGWRRSVQLMYEYITCTVEYVALPKSPYRGNY